MSREIKFRAWHAQLKKMYGVSRLYFYPDGRLKVIYPLRSLEETITDSNDFALMQFTGLLDKNGRGVYEDDIVKTGPVQGVARPFIGRIYWFEREFQWWITDGTNDSVEGIDYDLTYLDNYQNFEIIGNIYENPELLPDHVDN